MILPSVPAQEADKSLGGMIRQARQQVGETGLRIDVVEPSQAKIYTDEADRKRARLDRGVHGGGGRSRAIGGGMVPCSRWLGADWPSGRSSDGSLIGGSSAAELRTEGPEVTKSHNADIPAELSKTFFGFSGIGKVLDNLVGASIFELADRVLVSP